MTHASRDRPDPLAPECAFTGSLSYPTSTPSRTMPRADGLRVLLVAAVLLAAPPGRAAAAWVGTVRPSRVLQAFLDSTIGALEARDARLRAAAVRVAVLDLAHGEPPRLAEHHGDAAIYPASVVKFVYLMAAYRWQE